jgi:glycosyltransferase involved in cell wall biosynthesis
MNEQLKNILLVTARADFGGGPEHVYRLIKMLNSRVSYFVACPRDYPYWDRYREILGDDHLVQIPHREFKLSYLRELFRFIKKNQINIIHSHGKGAGIYGRLISMLSQISCVHTFHGVHIDNYSYPGKVGYIWIEKFLTFFTDKFISVSETEMERVISLSIADKRKITVINNGTVLPERISVFPSVTKPVFNITTISRFDYAKNTQLLIPIAQKLIEANDSRNFRFVIIGSGEEEEDFKKKLKEKNLDQYFIFTGMVPNPDDYLLDSFCYISTSRWEGLPLGVMEAMSIGVPVIATDVTGNKDLVEHNVHGFLYSLDKPGDASRFILQLAGDAELFKRLSLNGRRKISENFSLDKMADETFKLYTTLK